MKALSDWMNEGVLKALSRWNDSVLKALSSWKREIVTRIPARWMLVGILVANSLIAAFLIGGITSWPVHAEARPATGAVTEGTDPAREALLVLGRELAERIEQQDQREAEFEELKRGEEVRLRARLTKPEPKTVPEEASPPAEKPETPQDPAFARLSKAYENMEPDSAALALNELAGLDSNAVVQLLVGWPPRTSGAILDSLTQSNPELAAKLSYEIWKRSGKGAP